MIATLLFATALMAGSAPAMQTQAPEPAAGAAQATVSSVVVPPQKKPKEQDANTLVCRNEPVMGSRMTVKRCSTKAEIDERRLHDRADLEKMQGTGTMPR